MGDNNDIWRLCASVLVKESPDVIFGKQRLLEEGTNICLADQFEEIKQTLLEAEIRNSNLLTHSQDKSRLITELNKQLEAAKQRELELLAVIDEQNKFLERCITDEFGISNKYLRKEIEERYITLSQLLREHEAKVANEILDSFPIL